MADTENQPTVLDVSSMFKSGDSSTIPSLAKARLEEPLCKPVKTLGDITQALNNAESRRKASLIQSSVVN